MRAFFDTNVLVYIVTADPRKQQAERVLRAGGTVSVQVLNEFANVARKKLQHDWARIEYALEQFRLSLDSVRPLTLDTHNAALAMARDHRLPFYDALIVAAAIEADCDTLYTEDMQHGRTIGGVKVRNPFIESIS
ncbi:MAG: PIN domain-containing protein [Bradyrhizobium sp.]